MCENLKLPRTAKQDFSNSARSRQPNRLPRSIEQSGSKLANRAVVTRIVDYNQKLQIAHSPKGPNPLAALPTALTATLLNHLTMPIHLAMPIDPHHLQPNHLQPDHPQPLSDLLNLCQDPVLIVEPATGRLQRTNPAAQHWYGMSCAAGENKTLQSVFPDLATPEPQGVLSRLAAGKLEAADLQVFFTSTDGTVTRWNAALRRVECDGKTAIGIVLQHADTDWQSCPPSLEAIARRDPLTGLGDRNQLLNRLEVLLDEKNYGGPPFALLFIDLDNFKTINDRWGHLVGDKILVEAALRLRGCLRDEDLLVRFGGDEFMVLLEHLSKESDVQTVAKRIETAIGQPVLQPDGSTTLISASVGTTWGQAEDPTTPTELIAAADRAMYRCKESR